MIASGYLPGFRTLRSNARKLQLLMDSITPGKSLMTILIMLGSLAISVPFWLPDELGGEMAFKFILTGSMRGELGPGSFVVLRKSSAYEQGDIAGYRLYNQDGGYILIVHRIIGRQQDGRYIFKGDANRGTETVDEGKIVGKLVVGIPWLGFIVGTVKSSPVIGAAVLIVPMMMFGGRKEKVERKQSKRLFLVTLAVVAVTLPFYSGGVVDRFGPLMSRALILSFLAGARLIELKNPWPELKMLPDLTYMSIMALSFLMVPIPGMIGEFNSLMEDFRG